MSGFSTKSSGPRVREPPMPPPQINCKLLGLPAYCFYDKEKRPYKYVLGRYSCQLLACGADGPGLITLERGVEDHKNIYGKDIYFWQIFVSGRNIGFPYDFTKKGFPRQKEKLFTYSSIEIAAATAIRTLKIQK